MSWERLRSRIRTAMLTGEIALREDGFETPGTRSNQGLDTERHLDLLDALSALSGVRKRDSIAYRLLVRDIGRPCVNWRHFPNGHCDRLPLREIGLNMTWQEAEERTAEAIATIVDSYREA